MYHHVIGDIKAEDIGMILHFNLYQWGHSMGGSPDGLRKSWVLWINRATKMGV